MSDSIDIISIGECLIELSTNKSLTYAETFTKGYGGDTLSTVIAAARLGSKVGFITKVGNDSFRDYLLDSWQSENIDISYVKLVEGYNGLYFIAKQEESKKEFAYYRKKSSTTTLSVDDIPEDYIERASVIYTTGMTQSISTSAKNAVKKAFEIAKEKQTTVAYDPNYRTRLLSVEEAKEFIEEVIDYVDILLLSAEHDAGKIFELTSPDKVIKYFWDQGITTVCVKLGENGSAIGYNGEVQYFPAYTENIVDTTGAGDTYNGAFLHGIASGFTPFESAKFASIAAGLQSQGYGAIDSIPHREQVYAEFKKCEV